jgi:glucose-6-phosphate isomerase
MRIVLGNYQAYIDANLKYLKERSVLSRIWEKDHTVWKPYPDEIVNRLGWLTATDWLRGKLEELQLFGDEVRDAGFRYIVLLGMGGSSLCAETLRQVFGSSPNYPQLIVLDSTVPSTIKKISGKIDVEKTLFIVSSKSGTTIEPLCMFKYFRDLVESVVGKGKLGKNFIAITDEGTPLVTLGKEYNFRRIFINPSDIGGRYSIFSYFGMVPASTIGINIFNLLENAHSMQQRCQQEYLTDNPGIMLGTIIATLALKGKDKLTIISTNQVKSFSLWVEQLIAESTGKEGKGIIPVAGETMLEPESYGDDRLFVYIKLKDDIDNGKDRWIKDIESSGQPVITIELDNIFALGSEFIRWEFATVVAGALLGINPFDQPNVQSSKKATVKILRNYEDTKVPPDFESNIPADHIFNNMKSGNYLAILAYLQQSPELDKVIAEFRKKVSEKYRIATTIGYGPRYLHSTGQLYKGGPRTGHFLIITASHTSDLPIPDTPFNFGLLADAQALGDKHALQSYGQRTKMIRLQNEDTSTLAKVLEDLN